MNYLAHSLRFLDEPAACVGSCLPDMLSAIDRKCRLRERAVRPFTGDADPFVSELARGTLAHLADDHWFHGCEAFLTVSGRLTKMIRETLPGDESHRVWFLGHILTEILLDRWLIERDPTLLPKLYDAMAAVDPQPLQDTVNRMATRPTERLVTMYPRMVAERFLSDYPHDERLLYRLNGVMRRVKLPPLPDEFAEAIPALHAVVTDNARDLLPGDVRAAIRFG